MKHTYKTDNRTPTAQMCDVAFNICCSRKSGANQRAGYLTLKPKYIHIIILWKEYARNLFVSHIRNCIFYSFYVEVTWMERWNATGDSYVRRTWRTLILPASVEHSQDRKPRLPNLKQLTKAPMPITANQLLTPNATFYLDQISIKSETISLLWYPWSHW